VNSCANLHAFIWIYVKEKAGSYLSYIPETSDTVFKSTNIDIRIELQPYKMGYPFNP